MKTKEQIKMEAAVRYYRDCVISPDSANEMYSLEYGIAPDDMTAEDKQVALLNLTLWLGTVPTVLLGGHGPEIFVPAEGEIFVKGKGNQDGRIH